MYTKRIESERRLIHQELNSDKEISPSAHSSTSSSTHHQNRRQETRQQLENAEESVAMACTIAAVNGAAAIVNVVASNIRDTSYVESKEEQKIHSQSPSSSTFESAPLSCNFSSEGALQRRRATMNAQRGRPAPLQLNLSRMQYSVSESSVPRNSTDVVVSDGAPTVTSESVAAKSCLSPAPGSGRGRGALPPLLTISSRRTASTSMASNEYCNIDEDDGEGNPAASAMLIIQPGAATDVNSIASPSFQLERAIAAEELQLSAASCALSPSALKLKTEHSEDLFNEFWEMPLNCVTRDQVLQWKMSYRDRRNTHRGRIVSECAVYTEDLLRGERDTMNNGNEKFDEQLNDDEELSSENDQRGEGLLQKKMFATEIKPLSTDDWLELYWNCSKNRYDLLPNPRTRVRLVPGDLKHKFVPSNVYINANYVRNWDSKPMFLCTQAPLESTAEDFWTMIWLKSTKLIVMLTTEQENAKHRCNIYLPPSKDTWSNSSTSSLSACEKGFGRFKVAVIQQKSVGKHIIHQSLRVTLNPSKNSTTTRNETELPESPLPHIQVEHLWLKNWPDQLVPGSSGSSSGGSGAITVTSTSSRATAESILPKTECEVKASLDGSADKHDTDDADDTDDEGTADDFLIKKDNSEFGSYLSPISPSIATAHRKGSVTASVTSSACDPSIRTGQYFSNCKHLLKLIDYCRKIYVDTPQPHSPNHHPQQQQMRTVAVHCLAGLGRSGSFVAIWNGCEKIRADLANLTTATASTTLQLPQQAQIEHQLKIDVKRLVAQVRLDRGKSISNADQYEIIHRCLVIYASVQINKIVAEAATTTTAIMTNTDEEEPDTEIPKKESLNGSSGSNASSVRSGFEKILIANQDYQPIATMLDKDDHQQSDVGSD